MFSPQSPILFSVKLCLLNCALLCDLSLLIMSAKDKKSEVFSYCIKVKKDKCEFHSRNHAISLKKGLSNTPPHLC